MSIWQFLIGILGGGVLSSLITLFWKIKSDKIDRRVAALNKQLKYFYGPVHFFASQNARLFDLSTRIHQAYNNAQPLRQKEMNETLSLANSYDEMTIQNNDHIYEIMEQNFYHIDLDDVDIFGELLVDYLRLKKEWKPSGKPGEPALKTALQIYEQIGDISLMRPQFIERIRTKFNAKKEELASYTAGLGLTFKKFSLFSFVMIFCIGAIAHFARLAFRWHLQILSWTVPIWVSLPLALIASVLCVIAILLWQDISVAPKDSH